MPGMTIDHQLMRQVHLLGVQIGHTPLHRITRLFNKPGVTIYAKKEWEQLSGSVKARAGYAIFKAAIESGDLNKQKVLLDATSGNTGIAYATIGSRLGIGVTLCLPENASPERKEILKSLGAEIIYTCRFEGTDGAQQVAKALADVQPGTYFYADQYRNDNNWKAHYYSTALEIFNEQPGITHFVAGLGTTGTFTGTGRRLKELDPDIHLTSLQPDNPLHGLEGWKHLETAIVPGIYDNTLADDNLEVGTEEAWEMIKAAFHYERLLLSPSSAANLAGAIRVAEKLDRGIVVTVLPDNADKYKDLIKKLL
ncbi:cysteine synthase [Niastella yeongjuensis]|uniref:Cysteine synthase n=2 Tax=Niastella yeongjuensis TaxID=354355 RepID=A0A1V9FCK5_9BACT|nr:cysteine synthase [Niastella yeongjuensis]